ncbi:MAG: ComF family protein [Rubrivivax sp.]|nr:MAG: ComF family protein [Rubrivivax sp.]
MGAMAESKGAQYIDRMPTAPRPSLFQRWRLPWPGLCLICRQPQWDAICHRCVTAFASPRPRCQRCALPVEGHLAPCRPCDDQPPEFDRAVAAVDYTAPWSELIARFKFNGDLALSRPLSSLLAERLKALPARSRPQVIIPTPLSAARLRERGYNQTWHLARRLSGQMGIPALPHALRRVKDTARMMSLDADERRRQIRHAFEVAPEHRRALAGRHVAVVDDVLTTGATLNEITLTLQDAGVRSVSVWVLARTPSPGQ